MTNLLAIREAANAIGFSHSMVSRYVQRFPELNHGADAHPLDKPGELW